MDEKRVPLVIHQRSGYQTIMTTKILVSACLMGHAVRYDGRAKPLAHPALERWRTEGRLVTICPEMSAGMPVPRPPAEIEGGASGKDVLSGAARVFEITGGDVTAAFREAAQNALRLAQETGCTHALLIDGSPSCGSGVIYDGSFSGTRRDGNGVTAALLKRAGIQVFSDREIDRLVESLATPVA
ncbi:uncharacterized protein YbbK (DUF523 family) [Rhizobium mongolense USDA 1844]|uniref:Uncharacterized protein YbbK (DUF523 family) n=2 Tax=Rhizobium mongolense TaxID=57676 RepID=A0A559SRJ5_9HYPH|nr:uncharacterized protein YbbK (DUF523 family) [Rhizobium mongolense USDA 1844]